MTTHQERLAAIDALPPDVRGCVHDYGYTVVDTCLQLGVRKPKHIRHLVTTVMNELSPVNGAYSRQGFNNNRGGNNG
jgi:hypothetical protein